MNIKAVLLEMQPTKVVSDKFKSREIWVEVAGQYPQVLALQLTQEKCDSFNGVLGQEMEFNINLRGRKWTNAQGETKVFNTLECREWKSTGEAAPQPQAQAPSGGLTVADVENDDLPF
jgi:hypothetical protein